MKKHVLLAATVIVSLIMISCDEEEQDYLLDSGMALQELLSNCVRYVDVESGPGGDGLDWETAFDSMDVAVGVVEEMDCECEIWTKGELSVEEVESASAALPPDANAAVFHGFVGDEISRTNQHRRFNSVEKANDKPFSIENALYKKMQDTVVSSSDLTLSTAPVAPMPVIPLAETALWISAFNMVIPKNFRSVAAINTGNRSALWAWGRDNDGDRSAVTIQSGLGINGERLLLDGDEIDSTQGPLYLNHNSYNDIYLVPGVDGRVGIGTNNPAEGHKVEVVFNEENWFAIRSHEQTMTIDGNEIDSSCDYGLYINHNSGHDTIINDNGGNVGIGTDNPAEDHKVDVVFKEGSWFAITSSDETMTIDGNEIDSSADSALYVNYNSETNTIINRNGGLVGIGVSSGKLETLQDDIKLAVNGAIAAETIYVAKDSDWPDYVFDDDYNLMPLDEVSSFIEQFGHLPGVISEDEVKKNGRSLDDTQAQLLLKIEEITLYVIEQNNQIATQNLQMIELKKEIDRLSELVSSSTHRETR